MGNLAQLARYPMHFHKLGAAGNGIVVRGNSIWRSGNRGYQPHDTQGVLFEDNVSFDTVMSPYYVERTPNVDRTDPAIAPNDIWLVHNIGIQATQAPSTGTAQQNDAAIFWLENLDQVMMGNVGVAAGAYSGSSGEVPLGGVGPNVGEGGNGESTGLFPSIRTDLTGVIRPPIFLKNEFHSNAFHGLKLWNRNGVLPYDFVDVSTWRNGFDGINWGYYRSPHKIYQLESIENSAGIGTSNITGTGSRFVQDATITGNDVGIVQPYEISTSIYPDSPWVYTRVHLDNNIDVSMGKRAAGGDPYESYPIASRFDHAGYSLFIDPVFNSQTPLALGGQPGPGLANGANKNFMWRIINPQGLGPSYPNDFLLMRPDQAAAGNRTSFTDDFLSGLSSFATDPATQQLLVDTSLLPNSITTQIFGRNDNQPASHPFIEHSYTWEKQIDYAPQVSLQTSLAGKVATLQATATDDKAITKVEFWVDDRVVATDTSAPYAASVDLSNHPTRYA